MGNIRLYGHHPIIRIPPHEWMGTAAERNLRSGLSPLSSSAQCLSSRQDSAQILELETYLQLPYSYTLQLPELGKVNVCSFYLSSLKYSVTVAPNRQRQVPRQKEPIGQMTRNAARGREMKPTNKRQIQPSIEPKGTDTRRYCLEIHQVRIEAFVRQ